MISNIKRTPTSFECVINSSSTSIANTIRRCLYNIPIFAIDTNELNIDINDSIFHNEKIKHRLELIPIRQSKNLTGAVFEISNSFSDLPSLGISGYDKKTIVMSDNIKGKENKYFLKGMPITELRPGQKFKVSNIKLHRDSQINHARHQACIVSYDILEKGKIWLKITPCASVGDVCYPLEPFVCFEKSVEIILDMLDDFEKNLDNYKYEKIGEELVNVIIENQTHTLGHLLQSQILQLPEFKTRFCAYNVPHPLKKILIIKLTHSKPKIVIREAIKQLKKIYTDILSMVHK